MAQPDSAYDDKDKYIIDNFIMHGGKALWLIDPVYIDRDSFNLKGFTLGFKNDLNIDDILFKYGVRLNPVMVQDLQCSQVPVNMGFKQGQPNFQLYPWFYYPLLLPSGNHPIVKNLDLIRTEFISTLDTVYAKNVKKNDFTTNLSLYQNTAYTSSCEFRFS